MWIFLAAMAISAVAANNGKDMSPKTDEVAGLGRAPTMHSTTNEREVSMNCINIRRGPVALAIAALGIAGCGGEGGTSTLNLALTDAPVDDATTVWVQFTGVEVKPADGPAESFMFTAPKGYDLLTLQNGN